MRRASPASLGISDIPSELRGALSTTTAAVEWASEPIRAGEARTGAISVGPTTAGWLTFRYGWRWTGG